MTTPDAAPRVEHDDLVAELGGLALLWFVPVVAFIMALLGFGS